MRISRQKQDFHNFKAFKIPWVRSNKVTQRRMLRDPAPKPTLWLRDPEGTKLHRNVVNYVPIGNAYYLTTCEPSSSQLLSPIPHLPPACPAYRSTSTYLLLSMITLLPAVLTTAQHAPCRYASTLINTPLRPYPHELWRYYLVKVVDWMPFVTPVVVFLNWPPWGEGAKIIQS